MSTVATKYTARPNLRGYPVPLPDEIAALHSTMPRFAGAVTNPLYVPKQHQADQLRQWRTWMKEHRHVPPFLKDSRIKQLADDLLGSSQDSFQVE